MTSSLVYRLKEARILRGLTLREAVKGLLETQGIDISFQYLGKIEKKGCKMDSSRLILFANFYGVTVDYLIPDPERKKVEFGEVRFFKFTTPY